MGQGGPGEGGGGALRYKIATHCQTASLSRSGEHQELGVDQLEKGGRGGQLQTQLQSIIGAINFKQCPKLRVHPTLGVHISTAGCTILGGVHPVCARFLSHLLLLYIGRVNGAINGCTVLWEVHPASAQNKSLISDTGKLCFFYMTFILWETL